MRIKQSPNLQEGDNLLIVTKKQQTLSPLPGDEKDYENAAGRGLEGPGCYFQ